MKNINDKIEVKKNNIMKKEEKETGQSVLMLG